MPSPIVLISGDVVRVQVEGGRPLTGVIGVVPGRADKTCLLAVRLGVALRLIRHLSLSFFLLPFFILFSFCCCFAVSLLFLPFFYFVLFFFRFFFVLFFPKTWRKGGESRKVEKKG